jgi:hypothetical protein
MNEPTLRDVLDSLGTLHASVANLSTTVGKLETRFTTLETRFTTLDALPAVFAAFERRTTLTLEQHGTALRELSDDVRGIRGTLAANSAMLGTHSATLERIEQRF